MYMDKDHLIWTSEPDFKDWEDDLREEYPELSERELQGIMYERNNDYLDDERTNLNIKLGVPIIAIADLGRWNGRVSGYKVIESGNIRDCLYSDCDYLTWYVDKLGDLRCKAVHHDGTNYYLYRAFKSGLSEEQIENFKYKVYTGRATRQDITRYTTRLGDDIAKVYGFQISKPKEKIYTAEVR